MVEYLFSTLQHDSQSLILALFRSRGASNRRRLDRTNRKKEPTETNLSGMEKIEEGGGEAEEEEAGVNGGAEEEMALGVAAVVALKGEGLEEEMIEAEEVLIEARGGVEDLGATGIWIVKRTTTNRWRLGGGLNLGEKGLGLLISLRLDD